MQGLASNGRSLVFATSGPATTVVGQRPQSGRQTRRRAKGQGETTSQGTAAVVSCPSDGVARVGPMGRPSQRRAKEAVKTAARRVLR